MQIPDFDADDVKIQRLMQADIDDRFIYIWQDLPSPKSYESLVAGAFPRTSNDEPSSSKVWYFMTVGLLLLALGTFALQSRAAITGALSIHGNNILTEIGIPTRWKW